MVTYKLDPLVSHAFEEIDVQRDQDDEGRSSDDEIETPGEIIIEDTLRRKNKVNFVESILKLQLKPHSIS